MTGSGAAPGIVRSARPGAAVVGSGFVGRLHVDALRRLGIPVLGILGSTPERGAASAANLHVPKAYRSMEELVADPGVDVVHVASPNHLHARQVAAVLAAGRHVICEKPLALTSAESGELARQAADGGLVNAVCFNLRFYQLNQHVAERIRREEIGEVRLISGHYLQDWLFHERDWNWRLEPEQGGRLRAVSDIGSHWLDLAETLTGMRIEEVCADLPTFMPVRYRPSRSRETFAASTDGSIEPVGIESEDAATILLRFAGGARGAVVLSQVSAGRKNSLRYEIAGSIASLSWESEQPDQLWIGHRDRANELLYRDPAIVDGSGRAATRLPAGHVEGYADTFRALFAEVYADVAAGAPAARPAYPTLADGNRAMLVGEAIAESARTARWAAVRTGDPEPAGEPQRAP